MTKPLTTVEALIRDADPTSVPELLTVVWTKRGWELDPVAFTMTCSVVQCGLRFVEPPWRSLESRRAFLPHKALPL